MIEAPNSHFDTSPAAQSARRLGVRGDRSKLAQRFVADAYAVWEEQGEAALRRFIFHDPGGFAKMISGLLPQKLEITHPTDGLTDDRLAQLLELAERMAALKAAGVPFIDEKRLIDVTPEEGGGGPDRVGSAAGEGCPSPDRAAENPASGDPSNRLDDADSTSERLIAEESTFAMQPPVGRPHPRSGVEEQRSNLRKLAEAEIDPASLF